MEINKPLNNYLPVAGRRVPLFLPFDRVLLVSEAWNDDELDQNDKIALTIKLLVKGARWRRWLALQDAETRGAAITSLFNDYISTGPHRESKGPRAFDIQQDAAFLYAAFMQAYKIDLYKEQGRMDWRIFSALLAGLPTGTRLSEIMDIRTREVPKPDKYNAKERAALLDAKAFYRLKPTKDDKTLDEKMKDLFDDLAAWAKSK